MFQQARIQLSTEEQSTNTSPPPLIKRSSSNWSIPCCSNFSIRGQRIQLPDDSDNEEQEEFIINNSHQVPTAAPFTMSFDSSNENTFTQHASNLSRNPFARVTEEERPVKPVRVPEVESETLSIEAEASEEIFQQNRGEEDVEELADFTTHSANKYANEPDWTEMYQDEDETSVKDEPTLNTQQNIQQVLPESQITEDSLLSSQQSIEEEEEEEDIPTSSEISVKQVEKIPQIDEQVLHLLPLPQLSNEIPPALIHKKPSFERSMYGEEPLTSISTKKPSNRISRFSMTEEDFLKLKKQEEEEKNKLTHTKTIDQSKETKIPVVKEEDEVESLSVNEDSKATVSQETNTKQQQEEPAVVTQHQQRRSSIVATAAQSILGDKLDDFTEKLAFIKKNIIMSIDSDDDEDIEEADNAETTLKKIAQMKNEQMANSTPSIKTLEEQTTTTTTATRPPNHRRASSLMDVGPTIARFMNQISGTTNTNEEKRQVSPTSTTSTSFSPSSLFSALAGPEPSATTTTKLIQPKSPDQQDEDEEELFDFTKVIEIGKNVKSFSEGFVGNGIRMFNDVATRMKNSAEEEERQRNAAQKSDEDDDNDDHSNWLNDSYI